MDNNKPGSATKKKNRKRATLKRLVPLLVAVVVVVAGVWTVNRALFMFGNRSIDKGLYQAVFLSNGQVYFGKLHNLRGEYIDLREIYYLQMQNSDNQQSDDEAADAMSNLETASDVKLIKLGNELHGPTDKMMINKDQVLFWENMQSDSKVSQAIGQYKQGQEE